MKKGKTYYGLLGLLLYLVLANACEDLLGDMETGDPRDNIVDTWKCDEESNFYKSAKEIYWVEISKHPTDSTRIIIYNFYNVKADAEAVMNGLDLTLPLQTIKGGFTVSGTGRINKDYKEIHWQYIVDDGSGQLDNASAVYSRL